MESYLRIFRR